MDSDVAPANSLKGRLQRGRGQGYLDALSAPSEEARAALLDCIVRDPRWDSQVESRSPTTRNLPRVSHSARQNWRFTFSTVTMTTYVTKIGLA
jgi:hypothetical protein